MAFGKNPSNLNAIGAYGQASLGQQVGTTSRRGRSGGRSRRPYWAGNFEMSENPAQPDRIRLLRGDYQQQVLVEGPDGNSIMLNESYKYLMIREHYHGGKKKGAICSGGPHYLSRKDKDPCNGCTFYWSEKDAVDEAKAQGRDYKRAMSMTDKFVFSIFDYSYYFQMPQTDRSGQFRMNPRTNQPYTDWVKAHNPQDPMFAGHPWKEGNVAPWLMGKQYRDVLLTYSDVVGAHCVSCGNQNCISTVAWYCSNPQCNALIVDPNATPLSDEQRKELNGLHKCSNCQQNTYLYEHVACGYCPNGKKATLFDVDLYVCKMRGSDNKTQLMVMSTSAPGPIVTNDPAVAAEVKPLDLAKKFAVSSIEEQYDLWGDPPAELPTQQAQQQPMQVPQPVTGSPMPPPQPTAPMVGMPQTPPLPQTQGFHQPPPPVNQDDVNAQLQALIPRTTPQQ